MLRNRSYLFRYFLTGLLCFLFISAIFNFSGRTDTSRDNSPVASANRQSQQLADARTQSAIEHSGPPWARVARRPSVRPAHASLITGAPVVPNITAALADALQVDNNNSGKADPGDTLMYTVTITNTGTDATGVVFTDDLSQNGGNLTLVAGSVNSSPVAVNDSYPNGIGNTRMVVAAASGVLVNDFDPDGTTPTAVPITNGSTTLGGKVTLLADGSFTYDPPVGVTATTDTFTYTATDGTKTDTGTVSITLTSLVW